MSTYVSRKSQEVTRARRTPTVLLPDPGMPTRTVLTFVYKNMFTQKLTCPPKTAP
jgi:hypothetical protein